MAKDVAETSFNDPPKSSIGVLVALTITTSFHRLSFAESIRLTLRSSHKALCYIFPSNSLAMVFFSISFVPS